MPETKESYEFISDLIYLHYKQLKMENNIYSFNLKPDSSIIIALKMNKLLFFITSSISLFKHVGVENILEDFVFIS